MTQQKTTSRLEVREIFNHAEARVHQIDGESDTNNNQEDVAGLGRKRLRGGISSCASCKKG